MTDGKVVLLQDLERRLAEAGSDSGRLAVLLDFGRRISETPTVDDEGYIAEAIELARKVGTPAELARAGIAASEFYRNMGNITRSIECAGIVRQAADVTGNPMHRGQHFYLLGRVHEVQGDYRAARECYQSSLRIWRGIGNLQAVAAALNQLGGLAGLQGRATEALDYYQQCLKIDAQRGDAAQEVRHQHNIGWMFHRMGRWEDAFESYYRAIARAEQLQMLTLRASALNSLGELFLERDKPQKAIHMFRMVLAAARLGEVLPETLHDTLGNLGLAYFRQRDFASAAQAYDQALTADEKTGDRRDMAAVLGRMAELALEQGQLERCRELAERSAAMARDLELQCEEAQALRVLALEHAASGDGGRARECFERALSLLRDLEEGLDVARVRFHYGRFLLQQGENELAVAHLKSAAQSFHRLGIAAEAHEVNRLLFRQEMGSNRDMALLQGISGVVSLGIEPQMLLERAVGLLLEALKFDRAAVLARGRPVLTVGDPDFETAVALGESREVVGDELVLSWSVRYGGRPLGRIHLQRAAPGGAEYNYLVLDTVANLLAAPIHRLAELAVSAAEERPSLAGLRYTGVVSRNPRMVELLTTVCAVADKCVPVLIRGESGTGKELIARALHDSGSRAGKPFVAVNCAAVPENLLEAEFFGIEKGTATGVAAHKGKFEVADGGTVFLDEVGDMSPGLQSRLLRVLQEKTFERVGGRVPIQVDVRVVAATNQPMEQLLAQHRFREDLYYRLNTVELLLPSLHERAEDIPDLVRHFIRRSNQEFGRNVRDVGLEAMSRLAAHRWTGNVRELQHVIERSVLLARGDTIQLSDLPAELQGQAGPQAGAAEIRSARREAQRAVTDVERCALVECLEKSAWNVERAARLAGYSRAQFYRLMQKYSISRPQQ